MISAQQGQRLSGFRLVSVLHNKHQEEHDVRPSCPGTPPLLSLKVSSCLRRSLTRWKRADKLTLTSAGNVLVSPRISYKPASGGFWIKTRTQKGGKVSALAATTLARHVDLLPRDRKALRPNNALSSSRLHDPCFLPSSPVPRAEESV